LWDDLTAYEHLILFGKLRGISDGSIDAICEAKLEDVGLLPEKDVLVGHFSGGMKRRLSVILSFIGNPHIVYLDEPTTGMDP
jgi:ABC-type multidrug transport system ATPase subunit